MSVMILQFGREEKKNDYGHYGTGQKKTRTFEQKLKWMSTSNGMYAQ